MSEALTSTAISESLVNRDIYSVCDTSAESIDRFHGELYQLRKRFFTEGGRKVHLKLSGEYLGCKSIVSGSISRHSLKWKKQVNGVCTEEAFSVQKSFVVVLRDLNASICGKIHFDRSNRWIKTEYFSPSDYMTASIILKPGEASDTVERFTYNEKRKNYDTQILYPLPYAHGLVSQNLINAAHGDQLLLVSTTQGEFCYCTEEERARRLETQKGLEADDSLLAPQWEVEATEAPEEASEQPPRFTDLDTPAHKDEAPQPEAPSAPDAQAEEPAQTPHTAEPPEISELPEAPLCEEDLTLEVEQNEPQGIIVTDEEAGGLTLIADGEPYSYTGKLIGGLREGRGRTDQIGGLTLFDGSYRHGLRHGFGAAYNTDGSLNFVGSFKDDKREGAGISFRKDDYAMHVTTWSADKPGEFATLFDPQGGLRYSGKIVGGKKSGCGLSFRPEDNCFFVGKYIGTDTPDYGSLFDSQGNLLYTGGWKDGKRHGQGTEFDTQGQIVYSGQWKDDKYLNGVLYRKISE